MADGSKVVLDHAPKGLRAAFDAAGMEVRPRAGADWSFRLRVTGLRRDGVERPAASGAPSVEADRVVYRHSWGREWYENRAEGIEQLFEVRERTAGEGPLRIMVAFEGLGLSSVLADKAAFSNGSARVLEYGKILVHDAAGSYLAAHLEEKGGELALRIEDANAEYPILVDPLLTTPPDAPDAGQWETNGTVRAVLPGPNGIVYIGGDFSIVGPRTGSGVPVSPSTALPLGSYPRANGPVYAALSDGAGGWYVGGDFTVLGTVARNRIGHVLSTGIVSPWDPSVDGAVSALALSGPTLYIGGSFANIGGQPRNRIAALDTTSGAATSWNPDANGAVSALALSGSTLYVGGSFTFIGGQTRNRIAALNVSNGTADAWNPNADGAVSALALSGATLYAGGNFGNIGGQLRNRIAALDTSSGTATSWNPNITGSVYALLLNGSMIHVGGSIFQIGATPVGNVSSISVSTGSVGAFPVGTDGPVRSLALIGAVLYFGGQFTTFGGLPRNNIAAALTSNGTPMAWNPDASAPVYALGASASSLYLGGDFTRIGGQPRNCIAALDAATGSATSWNPNAQAGPADKTVAALALSGTTLYAGGRFTIIGGQARRNLAALDTATGSATSWTSNTDLNPGRVVSALVLDGTTLYAGGVFSGIGGAARGNIAALSTGSGSALLPGLTGADAPVNALALHVDSGGSTLFVGGAFLNIGGSPRSRLAAFDLSTGSVTSWGSGGADLPVYALALSSNGNVLYVGGSFTTLGGAPRSGIGALYRTVGTQATFDPGADGPVTALAVDGSTLYAGGNFSTIGGQSRAMVSSLDPLGGVSSWNPGAIGATVNALALSGTTLYVGGSFTTIGGQLRQNLAAFSASRTLFVSSPLPNGTYGVGQDVPISVTFTVPVTVSGTPKILLETGDTDRSATYVSGSGTNTLTFHYTVQPGDQTQALSPVDQSSILLNGGSIFDANLQPLPLCMPDPFQAGSLVSTTAIVIDAVAPVAPIILSPASGLSSGNNAPVLTGTAEPGGTVQVFELNTLLGTVVADPSGAWSFAVAPLPDGAHALRASVRDPAGNVGPYAPILSMTVDTQPPTAPTLLVPNGGITNDPTPLLSGLAEPGSTVSVFQNGLPVGATSAAVDGTWWFTAPFLPDTLYSFAASAADAVGNVSPPSGTVFLTVDTVPPASPTLSSSLAGSTTSSTVIAFSGTSEAGTNVLFYADGQFLGETSTGRGTVWNLSTATLGPGIHGFVAFAIDPAGNLSAASAPLSITVDTSAPPPPVIAAPPSGTTTAVNTPTLSGSAAINGTVQLFDGPTLLGTTSVDGSGNWTFTTAPLSNGTHSFSARALDAAGNVSGASAPIAVTVNSAGLSIQITTPTNSPAYVSPTATVSLAGSASGGTQVFWRNETTGVSGIASGVDPWNATVPLTSGTNLIVITIADNGQGTATDSIAIDFTSPADAVPPTIAITTPGTSPSPSSISPVAISGIASDNVVVSSIRWTNAATGGDGSALGSTTSWDLSVPLALGANPITVTARDASGNAASASVTVTFTPAGGDTIPPTVMITNPTTNPSISSAVQSLRIGGAGADDVALSTVVWSNAANGFTGTAAGLGNWTATVPLATGTNVITVRGYDTSGNTGEDALTVDFTAAGTMVAAETTVVKKGCGLLGVDALLLLGVLMGLVRGKRRCDRR